MLNHSPYFALSLACAAVSLTGTTRMTRCSKATELSTRSCSVSKYIHQVPNLKPRVASSETCRQLWMVSLVCSECLKAVSSEPAVRSKLTMSISKDNMSRQLIVPHILQGISNIRDAPRRFVARLRWGALFPHLRAHSPCQCC